MNVRAALQLLIVPVVLSACSYGVGRGVPLDVVVLETGRKIYGIHKLNEEVSVAYEYELHPAGAGYFQELLDLRLELVAAHSAADLVVNLLVMNSERIPVFSSLLFERVGGEDKAGLQRALLVPAQQATSFAFVLDPDIATAPGPGIRLEEGENITGVMEWPVPGPLRPRIEYRYDFSRMTGSSPGVLAMELDVVNGELFADAAVQLVITDPSGRMLGGGLLFERRRRKTSTAFKYQLELDPYMAYSFDFVGGGFLDRNRSQLPERGFGD